MSRLSLYVLKQLLGPIALFAFLITSVVWLTTSLRLLDFVINRGQSAITFTYLTILTLPTLLVIILPLAYFFATLYALSKLNSDSELVVMASAGFSRAQLAVPVLAAAAIVMVLTYLSSMYLMPAGQQALNAKVVDIRANVGAALLNEGTFNIPAKGLTVFIREIDSDGQIRGVLVHDNRNPRNPITYLAEGGEIAQTPAGARLIMVDGTVEQSSKGGARLSVLKFDRYVFDLDQFAGPAPVSERTASERYLGELLNPGPELKPRLRRAFIAEAHNRISEPLYCIAFALIALAAVTRGRRARGAQALRITGACAIASVLRIAGYGLQGIAAENLLLCIGFYVIPAIGIVIGILGLSGAHPKPALSSEPLAEAAA
ncbi:MAG: LPS export ABC transporter permease LptF [Alphaproteobacteria bacterium]|nr:LPS export ABC transporter permease LptF [Alphaproteobacteria bacterium]